MLAKENNLRIRVLIYAALAALFAFMAGTELSGPHTKGTMFFGAVFGFVAIGHLWRVWGVSSCAPPVQSLLQTSKGD